MHPLHLEEKSLRFVGLPWQWIGLQKQHVLHRLDRRDAHSRNVHPVRLEHQNHLRLLQKREKFDLLQYPVSVHILAMLRFPILEFLVFHIALQWIGILQEAVQWHHLESSLIPPMLHEYA